MYPGAFIPPSALLKHNSPPAPTRSVAYEKRHLAHLYAAEALCILGRPGEALEHLAPLSDQTATAAAAAGALACTHRRPRVTTATALVGAAGGNALTGAGAGGFPVAGVAGGAAGKTGTSTAGGSGGGGAPGIGAGVGAMVSPEEAAEARASLHANLAAVHALQDNLLSAERCVRTAMGICPGSVAVLRMAVYVLIRQGNVAEALQVCDFLDLVDLFRIIVAHDSVIYTSYYSPGVTCGFFFLDEILSDVC